VRWEALDPMKTQLLTISVVFLAFCACGPKAQISGGKQGASEALLAATGPMKGGADKYGSKIDITGAVDVKCAQGGSASLRGFGVVLGGGGFADVGQSFTADYNNCGVMTDLGVATMNGSLAVVQSVKVDGSSVDVDQSIKGKLLWQGACDDFLDIDVTQKVAVSALTQTSGGVSMVLKGKVINTEGTFDFNEAVNVTAGKVSVVVTADKK
jgi:hypothetical protein